jgi:hypothetical protein
MNGLVHHYMRIASSTSQNCGISYFIFDNIASLAGSPDVHNVDPLILSDIFEVSEMKIHIVLISVFLVLRHEHVQKALMLSLGW